MKTSLLTITMPLSRVVENQTLFYGSNLLPKKRFLKLLLLVLLPVILPEQKPKFFNRCRQLYPNRFQNERRNKICSNFAHLLLGMFQLSEEINFLREAKVENNLLFMIVEQFNQAAVFMGLNSSTTSFLTRNSLKLIAHSLHVWKNFKPDFNWKRFTGE